MDHAKLLDVLTSLPVSHAILPHAVCFGTSGPTNHAICSYLDSSGYTSGPIRLCLFIDYIIKTLSNINKANLADYSSNNLKVIHRSILTSPIIYRSIIINQYLPVDQY